MRRTTSALLAATGTVAALLAVPAVANAAGSPSEPSAAACDRAPWQVSVQGRPVGLDAGDRGGDYLWHDGTGFHLRVTHHGDARQVYSGLITSPTPMSLNPVRLEGHDVARLSADRRTIVFAFADYGHIDGLDFHAYCASSITLAHLRRGTAALARDRVYLGATRARPTSVPVTLHRI